MTETTKTTVKSKKLLALNIKVLRKKYGFSQEKLAEIIDLSAQTISDIEGCRTWVSDKTLEKLASVLDVDIFQLFLPKNEDTDTDSFLYDRLVKLGTLIKDDIDKRLDQYYLTERSFSK